MVRIFLGRGPRRRRAAREYGAAGPGHEAPGGPAGGGGTEGGALRFEIMGASFVVAVVVLESGATTPARPGSAPRPLPVLAFGSSDRRPRPGHGVTKGSQSCLLPLSPCPLPPPALCAQPLPRRR